MAYASREEIDEKYRWDLSSMFVDDGAFEHALEQAQALPGQYAAYQGRACASADSLLGFLRFDDEAGIVLGKLANYAQRKLDEDTRQSKYQSYAAQVMTLYTQVAAAASWFSSELLQLTDEDMAAYYADEPELEMYRRVLDREFRMRPHTLSPAEELIMARAGDLASGPENIYSLFNDADLTFDDAIDADGQPHAVTHGSYIPLMMQPDRTLRRNAFKSLYARYGQFRNSCAAMLGAQAKQLKFVAESRKYESTLEMCLDRTEVPVQAYTNLIAAVHDKMDAMHRYIDLRKRALGLSDLHFYDLYVPIVKDVEMKFTYEQACDLICEALAPMGEEYLALVRRALAERWVDVYETPGKRSGAYSAGGYGMQPVILMNFQGELDDVFTLIHEMGHSIHTYLSCQNQPPCYADYVIFVAEVASTCNEALLTQHLLKTVTDPAERAYVLNHFLEQFRGTMYRQTMFAEFELFANELEARGAGVTADALCEKYQQLNEEYFGSGIVLDEEIAVEWARIPHFYYNYYVYQYATGFAAAIALSRRILTEGAPAVNDYLRFLSGGSSMTPIELLRVAGVDMEGTDAVCAALDYFDELVAEMEQALELG